MTYRRPTYPGSPARELQNAQWAADFKAHEDVKRLTAELAKAIAERDAAIAQARAAEAELQSLRECFGLYAT